MGILPSRRELKNFGNEHPFLSLFGVVFLGMSVLETMQAFTAPEGEGPFSWRKKLKLRGIGAGPESHFHPFSDSVKQHWGKHPGGETVGTRGYTHDHLGATTSTSTSTSSSHPTIVRSTMEEQANRYHDGRVDNLFGVSTTTSTSTAHPPAVRENMEENNEGQLGFVVSPSLRRRLSAGRMAANGLTGSHLGQQSISEDDTREEDGNSTLSEVFALAGVTPEIGGTWTE